MKRRHHPPIAAVSIPVAADAPLPAGAGSAFARVKADSGSERGRRAGASPAGMCAASGEGFAVAVTSHTTGAAPNADGCKEQVVNVVN